MMIENNENPLDEGLIKRLCSIDRQKLKIMVDTFFMIFGEATDNKENFEELNCKTMDIHKRMSEIDNDTDSLKENGKQEKAPIDDPSKHGKLIFGDDFIEKVDYKCSQCAHTFKYETSLYRHVNNTHAREIDVSLNSVTDNDIKMYRCTLEQCDQFFPSNIEHEKHLDTVHIAKVETDIIAKVETKEMPQVTRKKVPKNEKCEFCDFEFNLTKSNFKLISHLKTFHPNQEISATIELLEKEDMKVVCNICGEKLRSSQILVSHVKLKHSDLTMAPCQICGKLLKQHGRIIADHLQSHNTEGFKCEECGIILRSKKSYKAHKTVHMPEIKKVKCDECNLEFDRREYLRRHKKQIHFNIIREGNKCDYCGKTLSSPSKLKLHVSSVHLQEKPFSCNLCDYKTARKDNLSTHIKGVHGID